MTGSGTYTQSDVAGYVNYAVNDSGSTTPSSYPYQLTDSQSVDVPYMPSYMHFKVTTNSGYTLVGYKISNGSSPSGDIVKGTPSSHTLAYYYVNCYLEMYWKKEVPNVTLDFNIYTQNSSGTFEKSIAGGTTTFRYRDTSYQDHTETITSSTATKSVKAANGYGYGVSATANSGYRVLAISDVEYNYMYNTSLIINKAVNIYYGLTNYWTSYASTSFGGGDGSSTTPYLISTPEQLALFANNINMNIGRGLYYKQTADICLAGKDWIPIGSDVGLASSNYFYGYYDGNNYKITGMQLNGTYNNSFALFSFLSSGWVKNIHIRDTILTTNKNISVSSISTSAGTTVENCSSDAVIVSTGSGQTGGLFGMNGSLNISDCMFSGSIISGGSYVGGIAPTGTANYKNCKNYGTIESTNTNACVGGLVGYVYGGTIENSISTGKIKGVGKVGTFVGGNSGTLTIQNCVGGGSIHVGSTENSGCIVGQNNGSSCKLTINNTSFVGNSNLEIGLFCGNSLGTISTSSCYVILNNIKKYTNGDFSGFTIVSNMNNDLPMQNALFSVAIGGQTSDYIINHLKNKGFAIIS